ncbi:MAG TPA: hypothetical protein VGP80_07165 [Gemmatimonadales bacterium]|jgi:hypothetical protein|nr:hypothetical protein [Gemmatimonadales bacterium]
MSSLGWARSTSRTADTLRRGAWYPIVEKTPDGHVVVVQVDNRPVRVSRVDVEVRSEPPAEWCVVNRTGVMRPTFGGQAPLPVYAVCPQCRERQEFDGHPTVLTCQRCKKESAVDWADAF